MVERDRTMRKLLGGGVVLSLVLLLLGSEVGRRWDTWLADVPKYTSKDEVPHGGYPLYLQSPPPGSTISPHDHANTPDLATGPDGVLVRGDLPIEVASKALEKAMTQRAEMARLARLQAGTAAAKNRIDPGVLISQSFFNEYLAYRFNEVVIPFCRDDPVALHVSGEPWYHSYITIDGSVRRDSLRRYAVFVGWDAPRMPSAYRIVEYTCFHGRCACEHWPANYIDREAIRRDWKSPWPYRLSYPRPVASGPQK